MTPFKPFSLNIKGKLLTFGQPAVMGILNVTPDSFFGGSRTFSPDSIAQRAAMMIDQGADIIDIGGYSSRPGADDVPADEELRRLEAGITAVRNINTDIPISVDTFRADVARTAVTTLGADIINDISGGTLDDNMLSTVADTRVPYVMMHMRGTPADMQQHTTYDNITADIIKWFSQRLATFSLAGASDIIIDPGFGFSKTLSGNYELLNHLPDLSILDRPILVGISRKSMIYRPLGLTPDQSLNGTTVLNTLAIERGAAILRVHDVKEARQAIQLTSLTHNAN